MNEIKFENGYILRDGKKIGTIKREYRNGYHPAVLMTLDSGKKIWGEIDGTPDTWGEKISSCFKENN